MPPPKVNKHGEYKQGYVRRPQDAKRPILGSSGEAYARTPSPMTPTPSINLSNLFLKFSTVFAATLSLLSLFSSLISLIL